MRPPGHVVKRYNRFLPHLGVSYLPFGDEHQFFGSYTQEIAAPRTDNLYQSTCDTFTTSCQHYSSFTNIKPETSTTYQAGYRYLGRRIAGRADLLGFAGAEPHRQLLRLDRRHLFRS